MGRFVPHGAASLQVLVFLLLSGASQFAAQEEHAVHTVHGVLGLGGRSRVTAFPTIEFYLEQQEPPEEAHGLYIFSLSPAAQVCTRHMHGCVPLHCCNPCTRSPIASAVLDCCVLDSF